MCLYVCVCISRRTTTHNCYLCDNALSLLTTGPRKRRVSHFFDFSAARAQKMMGARGVIYPRGGEIKKQQDRSLNWAGRPDDRDQADHAKPNNHLNSLRFLIIEWKTFFAGWEVSQSQTQLPTTLLEEENWHKKATFTYGTERNWTEQWTHLLGCALPLYSRTTLFKPC